MLAPRLPDFYVALMNFAAAFRTFLIPILLTCCSFQAAAQIDLEEFRRLQGEVANLQDQNQAQKQRIAELTRRVEKLQSDLRDANERATIKMGDFVTREDLKKITDLIEDVDKKRENDRKVILEEFEKLGKSLAQASPRNGRRDDRGSDRGSDRDERTEPPAQPWTGKVLPYTVKPNQTLSHIREDFNKTLRDQGLAPISSSDILRANPGLNPNRIYVGQELLLPVPDKK